MLSTLRATYTTTVGEHISELMPLYLDPQLNAEWNQRMSTQRFVSTPEHGNVVHQTYRLPWPLKTRELVMHCTHAITRSSNSVTATCGSARSTAVPETSDTVRMEIEESQWTFEALPNGKTHIKTHILISEKFAVGVPSFVIKHVQDQSLKESVTQFIKASRRLKLPPHTQFIGWRRSREQARRAAAAAAVDAAAAEHVDEATAAAHAVWAAQLAVTLLLMVLGLRNADTALVWWRTRHAPRAVRRVARAAVSSRSSYLLTTAGEAHQPHMPRSVSLSQISSLCPADATRSTGELLLAAADGASQPLGKSASHGQLRDSARYRRSLSASNLENMSLASNLARVWRTVA